MGRGLVTVIFITFSLTTVLADNLDWWKSSVIYQIYPRSFKDSDGNGIGDLQGIIDKMDYIKQLGIDAVWLSPIYPTEDKDFGYDITDMKNIYNLFGNMSTFQNLVKELHDAGIKLIMDFVPNHTSNKHDWFVKSLKGTDKYKDYYVWRSGTTSGAKSVTPPNNWRSEMIGGSAWTYDNFRKQFYLHQFLPEQPDLNYENEEVMKEMLSVLEFWLNKGVDGFRMDAVFTICENQDFKDEEIDKYNRTKHEKTYDQPKTFNILSKFREKLDQFTSEDNVTRLMMIENYNSDPYLIKEYYGTKDAPIAHFPFNFYLIMNLTLASNATDWAHVIKEWYNVMGQGNEANWVLGNHDQHRVASRFSQEYVDLLNIITITLKGVTVTFSGEELGMPDSMVRRDQAKDPQGMNVTDSEFYWKSRDFERGPFLWNTSTVAGFSSSMDTWLPVSTSYWSINAKAQNETDKMSHLKIYRKMVTLKKYKTLKYGEVSVLTYNKGNILAIYRYYPDNPTVAAVINFASTEEKVDLTTKRDSLPNKLYFYTASLNVNVAQNQDKNKEPITYNSTDIVLPPKSAIVLSTDPLV